MDTSSSNVNVNNRNDIQEIPLNNDIDIDIDRIDLPTISLYLKTNPLKGRGVCSTYVIEAKTLINISPVLLFPSKFVNYNTCTSLIDPINNDLDNDLNKGIDHTVTDTADTDTIPNGNNSNNIQSEPEPEPEPEPTPSNMNSISSEREILNSYTYTWNSTTQALALGLGSMFNHSSIINKCNIYFQLNKNNNTISYFTLRRIEVNEELCIDYGPKLWFVDIEGKEARESGLDGLDGSGGDIESDDESVDEECLFGNMYHRDKG